VAAVISDYYQVVLNAILLSFAMFLLENLVLLPCIRGKALKNRGDFSVLRNCIFRSMLPPVCRLSPRPAVAWARSASAGLPWAGEGTAQLDSHFCWQQECCCQPSGAANMHNFEERGFAPVGMPAEVFSYCFMLR